MVTELGRLRTFALGVDSFLPPRDPRAIQAVQARTCHRQVPSPVCHLVSTLASGLSVSFLLS